MAWLSRLLRFLADLLTPADPNHVDIYGQRQAVIPEAFKVPEIPVAAELTSLPGVQMAMPPVEYFSGLVSAVDKFTAATLGPDDRGGIVGIAVRKSDGTLNLNLAVVQKIGKKAEVVAWVGKQGSWGSPVEGGVAFKARW